MDVGPAVRVARRQGGVVSVRQMLALGWARSSVDDLVTRHGWARPRRGVLALPGRPAGPTTDAWTALCAVGAPAWVTGPSALGARGAIPALVDLRVPRERHVATPPGVRLRRRDVDPDEVTRRAGPPAVRVEVALHDLAARSDAATTLGAVAEAVQRGTTTLHRCAAAVRPRTHGAARLRAAVAALGETGSDSWLAHAVGRLLAAHGLVLDTEVPVTTPDGRRFVLDAVVRGTDVVVEVDGHAFHHTREQLGRDRARQNALVGLGRRVVRVDWWRLQRDPAGVVADVRAAVAAEQADGRAPECPTWVTDLGDRPG